MSSSLIHGHEIDLEADFQFLQNRLSQALAHAYQYMNNTLSSDMRYYVRFIELRKNQQGLLKRVYRNLLKIQFVPSQAFPVSRFMKRIAESMQDYNNAEFLLSILSEMRKFYVSTVGYGDVSPTTLWGRIAAVLLMVVGVSIIGLLTSTITTYFEPTDPHEVTKKEIAKLHAENRQLHQELLEIKQMLKEQ